MTIRRMVCALLLVVFWSTATTAAAVSAAPSLDLPKQAALESTITVVGHDFQISTPVAIWLAQADVSAEPAPLVTDTDSSGSFSAALNAPANNPGAYLVLACQGCKAFTVARRECAAGVAVGLACSTISITVPTSTPTGSSTRPHGVTTRGTTSQRASGARVVAGKTSWTRFAVPLAVAAFLLAAAVVAVMLRHRRRPRRTQGDARLRPMPPPEIEVHDGSPRITLRLACSLPPADVYTEDVPR